MMMRRRTTKTTRLAMRRGMMIRGAMMIKIRMRNLFFEVQLSAAAELSDILFVVKFIVKIQKKYK